MDNDFKEQMTQVPSFVMPLTMYDNKYFLKWLGSSECKVWHRMNRHIVRGEMITELNKKLYNDYYINGKLVISKELKEIAHFLDLKDISTVSKVIISMVNKGIINEYKIKWKSRSKKVYELGYHDMGPYKHENLHMINYFVKLKANKDLEKFILND